MSNCHKYSIFVIYFAAYWTEKTFQYCFLCISETVSMIPPIVLDVKPHHKVLDMCAAPGSKTAQLIEAIHAEEDVVPKGLVVANDSDNSRCYMLVHQAKRLQSPAVIITNHDASIMPNMKITDPKNPNEKVNLRFDRILCDVPCSGDGTLRKNADIWPKWSAAIGLNLHGIQYRILKRGIELLEVGGRLVYSTCSLNPVEDEAVIQKILLEAGKDNLVLEDATSLVPGLKFTPGLSSWKVSHKGGDLFSKWADVGEKFYSHVRPSMVIFLIHFLIEMIDWDSMGFYYFYCMIVMRGCEGETLFLYCIFCIL